MQRDERSLFDGIDTSIAALAQFAGARPPKDLVDGLAAVSAAVQAAQKKFDTEATTRPWCSRSWPAFARVRVRARPAPQHCRSTRRRAFEIEFRLRQKEREFQQALIVASGIRVEALADDGVVVPGQDVKLSLVRREPRRRRGRDQAGEVRRLRGRRARAR